VDPRTKGRQRVTQK